MRSRQRTPANRYLSRGARLAGVILLFVIAALLGTVSGVLFAYADDLPEISALDDYIPNTITRVYSANGDVVGEFAVERRIIIGYDDIAPTLREAIIAAEDAGFNSHLGLSISRIIVTAVRDILYQRLRGASTLTQQLARSLSVGGAAPLGLEKTLERKIREIILSVQIEKRYTKREIFTLYCNQIFFGHDAHGVEAAARLYVNKSASDVNLAEAALLAGIIQTPNRQSPFVNPAAAEGRRHYVLDRMVEEGYITQAEADEARTVPIEVRGRPGRYESIAPHFVEEVRQHLEANYGVQRLYESGLKVETTLDMRLQTLANRALREGLRTVDKRHGFRKPTENVIAGGGAIERFQHDRWRSPITTGDIVPAVVTGVTGGRMQLRVGRYRAEIGRDGFAWTERGSAAQLVEPGDLIHVRITGVDEAPGVVTATLEQEPVLDGAVLVLDNGTGQILAMVGGYSFERSKFNRAIQARRQLGSLFKAFLYTAAIDRGYTGASILLDEPVIFDMGPDLEPYEPTNYDETFEGPITLRHAVEKSRNVPAVRMIDQLGPEQVVEYAQRFGFVSPLPPFLSIALGSAEATLLELTSAYAVFPNRGIRMRPYQIVRILDRDGNVLEEHGPESHDAVHADTAYVMLNILRGVVQRGTGIRAAWLNWPLAGKTGTVDDFTDAWFIGFDPNITVGVWVGYNEKRTMGDEEEGAAVALPIWIEIMNAYIGDRTVPVAFTPPGNIIFLSVDRNTGEVTEPWAPEAIQEAFISGTQPGTIAFQD